MLIIKNQKKLDQILSRGRLDKKIKYVIISLPLNNFENLVHFFKKIDKVLDDETKIIINYFSSLWRPIFFYIIKVRCNEIYFRNECYFSKNIFEIFLQSTNYKIVTI